jgi:hypothetical protein
MKTTSVRLTMLLISLLLAAVAAGAEDAASRAGRLATPSSTSAPITLSDLFGTGVPEPIFLTCSATWYCSPGSCPAEVSCQGIDACSAGGDGDGWVECDGNRQYCNPPCSPCETLACTHWVPCDRWCRQNGFERGACSNTNCCGCCFCE